MDILLMIFFAFKNFQLAKELDENKWKWSFLTAFTWIIFEIAGSAIYSGVAGIDLSNLEAWIANPPTLFLTVFCGVLAGYLGYLLVKRSLVAASEANHTEY
jgi:hypothetical protein